MKKQKSLKDGNISSVSTSDDSFSSVDNTDQTSQFEFEDAIIVFTAKTGSKFFSQSPASPNDDKDVRLDLASKSIKRANSADDSSERRTRSKSDNFRKSSLVITKVPLVK